MVGCNSSPLESCDSESNLVMNAPDLMQDGNGYYHMFFNTDYVQTFSTLKAEVGVEYWPVGWISNKEYMIPFMGTENWTNLVNQSSYSDDEGNAYTVLGVWEEFIGDTIKVYCFYDNECDIHLVDSLEVILW